METKFTIEGMAQMAPLFQAPGHTAGPGEAESTAWYHLARLARRAGRFEEANSVGLTSSEWFALDDAADH